MGLIFCTPSPNCKHIQREFAMICTICEQEWACELCHNERQDHQMKSNQILCKNCFFYQMPNKFCVRCSISFALYYCSICCFWTNQPNVFHCEGCKKCLVGTKETSYHCETCDVCFHIKHKHVCFPNRLNDDCCICLHPLDNNTTCLPCSHTLHTICCNQLLKRGFTDCPICKRSMLKKRN